METIKEYILRNKARLFKPEPPAKDYGRLGGRDTCERIPNHGEVCANNGCDIAADCPLWQKMLHGYEMNLLCLIGGAR